MFSSIPILTKTNSIVWSPISYGFENVCVGHPMHLLQFIGILKWDTISHMYKALTLMVVPIHRIEVLMNWFSRVSSRLRCDVSWLRRDISPRRSDEFPLSEDFPTASEERFPLLSQKDATADEVRTADKDKE
nr:hypothetical protein [Tanacetum cinerariifolium]